MMPFLTSHYAYLTILVFSLSGLALIDWHWRLVIFDEPRAAILSLGLLVLFFLCWDLAGLGLRIFSTNQTYVSGIHLGTPNLPIEELLFLSLLNYVILICYQAFSKRGSRA